MANDSQPLMTTVQTFVYGSACTLVLPGVLFVISAVLVGYRGITQEHSDMPLAGFLANIMLQMTPLIALKIKIWMAADRVSLVPLVLAKTLMIHATLEFLRISSQVIHPRTIPKLPLAVDFVGLFSALALLKYEFEYPINPMVWAQHIDVRNLVALACGASLVTEVGFAFIPEAWMDETTKLYFQDPLEPGKVMFTAANYIDIVAFMPIVWRLYKAENELEEAAVGTTVSDKAKRQVRMFFLFVGAFYLWDDVIDPIMGLLDEPVAMMAHAAHFMLLLDFAGFFTFQVSQPASLASKELNMERGEQLQGLLSQEEDDY